MTERPDADFDQYAAEYDASLAVGLRLTGADKRFYATERIREVALRASRAGLTRIDRVLDFGCGDGDAALLLRELLGAREIVGADVSGGMLARARARHPYGWVQFVTMTELPTLGAFDLAYCNGVFHHIPRAERVESMRSVHDALRAGGLFAMWENHPWNPGTRLVMSRVSFDADADLLSPPAARRLAREGGLRVLRTDHRFVFPGGNSALRPLERLISRLPVGGQYQVLSRRDS
jgi:SAM-dependent methyltransferase